MRLFFKNGIKQLLKSKLQFIIYILLTAIAIFFASVFGISSLSLQNSNKMLYDEQVDYQYSYRYTATDYSANDTATISPWFAFDNELISAANSDGEINYYPVISIYNEQTNPNGVLRPVEFKDDWVDGEAQYDSYLYNYLGNGSARINFQFGDVESDTWKKSFSPEKYGVARSYAPNYDASKNIDEYINDASTKKQYEDFVARGEFGAFYKFNFDSVNFKTSLIGKLYEKYNFQNIKFDDAASEAKEVASNIFWYMFYLNNSNLTDAIKTQIITYLQTQKLDTKTSAQVINDWINKKDAANDGDASVTNKNVDVQTSGFQGQVGWINNEKYYINDAYVNADTYFLKNGSYQVKNYGWENIFETQSSGPQYSFKNNVLTASELFDSYNKIVGDLANFTVNQQSQVVMWGIGGEKYRYVSAYHQVQNENGIETTEFNNPDVMKIYSQRDDASTGNLFIGDTFISSSGYARTHSLQFGSEYSIIPGYTNYKLRFDAIGGDGYNSYPTIYEEDLLTDNKLQAVFYLNDTNFKEYFSKQGADGGQALVDDTKFQDTSRNYLKYKMNDQSNMESDMKLYRLYLANNITKINDSLSAIKNLSGGDTTALDYDNGASKIQSSSETTVLNLRSNLLGQVADIFLGISVVFSIIFILIILFVVYNIVRRLLHLQKSQIGNLKSLGVKNATLVINFVSYMLVPIIIIIPAFWGLSFLCQSSIMNIFYKYFNIPTRLDIDWKFLIYEMIVALLFIGGLVFIVAYSYIKKNPLELMSGDLADKPNMVLTRLNAKIKYKKFTSKLRSTILITSFKSVIIYFTVFFISTMIMTLSLFIPDTLGKMTDKYYENIHYQNAYNYNYNYSNMPLSQYSFYQLDNNNRDAGLTDASTFNVYSQVDETNYASILDWNSIKNLSDENKKAMAQHFEDVLYNNLIAIKGNNISVGVLDKILATAKKIDAALGTNDVSQTVSSELNQLACSFIPTVFGQKAIDDEGATYDSCVQQVANNLVPSSVKEMWDQNPQEFKRFNIDFGNVAYDTNDDQLYTTANIVLGNNESLTMDGIDPNQKNNEISISNTANFWDYDVDVLNKKIIPITVNKKAKLKGVKVGDVINANIQDNALYLGSDLETKISPDWWQYSDNEKLKSIYGDAENPDGVDLSHLTFFEPTIANGTLLNGDFYWKDSAGQYQPYAKMQNIKLVIPSEIYKVNQAAFDQLLTDYISLKQDGDAKKEIYTDGVFKVQDNGDLILSPFDIRDWTSATEVTPVDIATLTATTSQENLWSMALKEKLVHESAAQIDTGYKLKVVGYQDTYDGEVGFINQVYLNNLLGYANPERSVDVNGQKINIYSNAKLSNNSVITDQMQKIIFQAKMGDTSFAGFSTNLTSAISNTTYVAIEKGMMESLINSVFSLGIIFIVISLITAVIMVYLITDLSIGKFKNFMSFMRVQGYTMKEINSIFMWIFAPTTLVATILGSLIVYFLLQFLLPAVLVSIEIAVPLQLQLAFVPLVVLIGLAIFIISYVYVLITMKRIRLATLTNVS
jgi:putative ABC transport system permease protein